MEECKRLEELYDNDNIQLVPVGLSDKPGKKILYLTNEPACSSLYKPNENLTKNYPALDCAREVSQVEVEVSTLDVWAKDVGVDYIDYIKIDTQGAELNILKGASEILPSVRFLEVEVEFNPIYDGQPIFSEVDLFLRGYGFVLWKLSNLVHYSKNDESEIIMSNDSINYDHHRLEYKTRGGQIYWADAFYVRKEIIDTVYDEKSIEQIKRDAEIAHRLGFFRFEMPIR
ncbi:methyltransferase2C FkbM family domain protein [gamma proteobacterium IMCC2047]|nr:methyltransferase2C FkbM family domain protein [gamma proteobacterium IMCC2047]